jgi:hypothetical protein
MTAPTRALLPDLPKGHEFEHVTFAVTRDEIARYLDAVGDTNAVYLERGLAPPLAVAARALGALLQSIELPGGSLHTGQEVEARAGISLDAVLTLSGSIAQRSERAGMVISIIEFDLTPEGAPAPALSGRSTVMVQGAATP